MDVIESAIVIEIILDLISKLKNLAHHHLVIDSILSLVF